MIVKRRFLKIHAPLFVLLAFLFVLFCSLEITCPILFLLGVPCPTCGCTRALACLLFGDLRGYIEYHPLALFLLLAAILMLHQRFFPKKALYVFVFSVLAVNAVFYVYRLVLH